jgi:hypothetical protein
MIDIDDEKGNIATLKDRYLYHIHARNGHYGIWILENNSFLLSRIKFGENYPFEEYHWNVGCREDISYGTAYEKGEAIEKVPFEVKMGPSKAWDDSEYEDWCPRKEILEYLNKFENEFMLKEYNVVRRR